MGIRPGGQGKQRGIALDCLICHSGSIAGKSYVGLPNTSLEYQALVNELTPAGAAVPNFGVAQLTLVRGTSQAAPATVAALSLRHPNMTVRKKPLNLGGTGTVPEDPPAWWLLKKKKTTYHTGMGDAKSLRSMMIFLLDPRTGRKAFKKQEKHFADILTYLRTIEAPKYPFKIDKKKAAIGKKLFVNNCSECHGTYGKNWTYPNRIVALKNIGTDPERLRAYSKKFSQYYNASWLGAKHPFKPEDGYQAPPFDGIWATAPYLHNGSVPTLEHLLNSTTRPEIFTRSYKTDRKDYDEVNVGWKIEILKKGPNPKLPPIERRRIYDTRQTGLGNSGHTLTRNERAAIIEYLKTI